MTFYQLAFRYLRRKRGKTVLLLLVLVLVNSMILSTTMILRATEESKASIQAKTNSKIVLDILDENKRITDDEVKQITRLDEVASVNRISGNMAFLSDDSPVTSSDSTKTDNLTVSLLSYDELQYDSAFFEERYRLTSGQYLTADMTDSVVINSLLAESNGLKLGDEMTFESPDGKTVSAKIIGLFLSGSERKQTDSMAAAHRIENQIFMDNSTYEKLFKSDGFYKVAVYTKNPQLLEILQHKLDGLLGNHVEMTTSDILYKQLNAPLEQMTRVTKLMLLLTFVTGTIVVSLLLCMWMRTRQKEAAIFISIGKSKASIFLQLFLESLTVFLLSVTCACGLGRFNANILQSVLTSSDSEIVLNVYLQFADMAALVCLGGLVIVIAVSGSFIPLLKSHPNTILSKVQ